MRSSGCKMEKVWWRPSRFWQSIAFPHSLLISQTAVVVPELKWGQQMKNYHQCLQNSIIDGVLTSQMLQINPSCWWFHLPGGCIKFLINYTETQLAWADIRVSVILEQILSLPENTLTWGTFLSVSFSPIWRFYFLHSQYLIGIPCLCWTCSHHLWTWSLRYIRLRNWISRWVSWLL